jgi:TRAP-type C4-dicarboxylate transport system permease small subunit
MRDIARRLQAGADHVAAGLLAAMFATFIFQVLARYVFLRFFPEIELGWTVEFSMTLWLWVVLWGAAFCLPETSHVRFDLFYQAAGRRSRRVMAFLAALIIVAAFAAALPATWDYITFYKIKKSAILKWRLDYVFGIYALFAVAIIGRYIWRAALIVRGQSPGEDDTDNSAEILANGGGRL